MHETVRAMKFMKVIVFCGVFEVGPSMRVPKVNLVWRHLSLSPFPMHMLWLLYSTPTIVFIPGHKSVRIKLVLFYQLLTTNGLSDYFRLRGGLGNILPQPLRVNLQEIQKCLHWSIGYSIKSLLKILQDQQQVWFMEIFELTILCSIPLR